MNPHDNQIVVDLDTPSWGFDEKTPAYYVSHSGTWQREHRVDPAPCYAHDVGLVRAELDHLRKVAPLPFPLAIFVLHHEVTGRTNGCYCEERDYSGEPVGAPSVGIIVLSGKRIPIHPAMTRYLVSHEYGHAVDHHITHLRGLKGSTLRDLYREQIRPTSSSAYGCGRWHANTGELLANDFRILVAKRELEFWPHPGFSRPEDTIGAANYWIHMRDELLAEPATAAETPAA